MRVVELLVLLMEPIALGAGTAEPCGLVADSKYHHRSLGDLLVFKDGTGKTDAIALRSRMQVDSDGAPDAYHPDNIGISHLCKGMGVGAPCHWTSDCLDAFHKARSQSFRGEPHICFYGIAISEDG